MKRYVFNSTGMEEHPQGSFIKVSELRQLLEERRNMFESWFKQSLEEEDKVNARMHHAHMMELEELLAELGGDEK